MSTPTTEQTIEEFLAAENLKAAQAAAADEKFFNQTLSELGIPPVAPTENEDPPFEINNQKTPNATVEERAKFRQQRRLAKARQT